MCLLTVVQGPGEVLSGWIYTVVGIEVKHSYAGDRKVILHGRYGNVGFYIDMTYVISIVGVGRLVFWSMLIVGLYIPWPLMVQCSSLRFGKTRNWQAALSVLWRHLDITRSWGASNPHRLAANCIRFVPAYWIHQTNTVLMRPLPFLLNSVWELCILDLRC